jgi:hypothetical protein
LCIAQNNLSAVPKNGKIGSGTITFLVATSAASAAWLLLTRRSQNRRVRVSGASESGDYAPDSEGWSLGWFGYSGNSTDGCSGHDTGHGDSGGSDGGGGGDGGGNGGGD